MVVVLKCALLLDDYIHSFLLRAITASGCFLMLT